ncbi:ABC transporter substrate-binding protein [Achromobacter seleniivolatilans]|uniref:ABC transporter substrate-binding protein n=2 Tax=Achromobacter seleniivolatilans TaxID=3047478 RepID=A0ABY9M9X9_9BURK|nr:ABC transporter substrate-binding protein [Achromobacter sp. R39]WMD23821.1 ABC transporter substrate-binding protein [Achromobacter sp. R39]
MPRTMTRSALACGAAVLLLNTPVASAQISDDVIRIGFITDLSGVYSGPDGPGGVEAIKMAIEEMGGEINGKKIELLTADHQNKADIASAKAREWFDQKGLDMLIGGTNSSTALAMSKVAADKKKPIIVVGAGAPALTNEQCTPYTLNYAYDTVALARGTGSAVVKAGGKTWYFLTADYAFGNALQADTTKVVEAGGGKVVGSVKHPLSSSDFSSFLLQAQGSKAEILALANAGADATSAIKAANEFGITKTMRLAGLIMFINDIHAMGLPATQGMYLTDSWYWNASEPSRAWSQKFFEKRKAMPSSLQAADYSAALQYLRAVKATGTDDADRVLAYMRENKLNDMYIKDGVVRPDGRVVHDMYLLQVKTPEQSKEPWDYFNVLQTIDGHQAFTTQAESRCTLWK